MNRIDLHGVGLEVAHLAGNDRLAPLVFLHEGLGSVSLWTQRGVCWPRLLCDATGHPGWLYSRRGYGQSDPVADVRGEPRQADFWHVGRHEPDYMHREAWEVLPELLARCGIERPILVGHSDGATIALLHAARYPVRACVAIAPHAFVEPIAVRSITQARDTYLDTAGSPEGLRARLARHHRDVDNAFWQWNDVWLSDAFARFDILDECARITAPLLLVQGDADEYGTLDQLSAIQGRAPHARTGVLAGSGHSPHRDKPHELTALVRQFLTEAGIA